MVFKIHKPSDKNTGPMTLRWTATFLVEDRLKVGADAYFREWERYPVSNAQLMRWLVQYSLEKHGLIHTTPMSVSGIPRAYQMPDGTQYG